MKKRIVLASFWVAEAADFDHAKEIVCRTKKEVFNKLEAMGLTYRRGTGFWFDVAGTERYYHPHHEIEYAE